MSKLAKLLELLDSAPEEVSSFTADLREWSNPRPTHQLVLGRDDSRSGHPRWRGPGPWPTQILRTRRIWFVSPALVRVEILRNDVVEWLGVRDETKWWRWDRDNGATSGEIPLVDGVPFPPPMLDPPLLSPVRLISALRLEPVGVGIRADRDVLIARAWPRGTPPSQGPLSYEFEFDAEHGTVLRRAVFEDRRCVQVTEAVEVLYEGRIDREQFVFVAPNGQQVRRIEMPDAMQRVRKTQPAPADSR